MSILGVTLLTTGIAVALVVAIIAVLVFTPTNWWHL